MPQFAETPQTGGGLSRYFTGDKKAIGWSIVGAIAIVGFLILNKSGGSSGGVTSPGQNSENTDKLSQLMQGLIDLSSSGGGGGGGNSGSNTSGGGGYGGFAGDGVYLPPIGANTPILSGPAMPYAGGITSNPTNPYAVQPVGSISTPVTTPPATTHLGAVTSVPTIASQTHQVAPTSQSSIPIVPTTSPYVPSPQTIIGQKAGQSTSGALARYGEANTPSGTVTQGAFQTVNGQQVPTALANLLGAASSNQVPTTSQGGGGKYGTNEPTPVTTQGGGGSWGTPVNPQPVIGAKPKQSTAGALAKYGETPTITPKAVKSQKAAKNTKAVGGQSTGGAAHAQ